MAGVNKQIIIGNLGADPEIRETKKGTKVANMRVAVNERVKKGEEWTDHTEWFSVVTYGKNAENAAKYLSKGRQVYCEGPSRFKEYTKKDGSTGYSREITVSNADNLRFLQGGDGQRKNGESKKKESKDDEGFHDDLPF